MYSQTFIFVVIENVWKWEIRISQNFNSNFQIVSVVANWFKKPNCQCLQMDDIFIVLEANQLLFNPASFASWKITLLLALMFQPKVPTIKAINLIQ